MTETVLDRFKKAISFLIDRKIANKKKEIAISCEVTPNYLSGVLYERISLSGELIQKFLSQWPINPAYLTCQSDQIHLAKVQKEQVKSDNNEVTTNVAIVRLINRLKSDTISRMDRLDAGDELSELIAKLVDENINLRRHVMGNYEKLNKNL